MTDSGRASRAPRTRVRGTFADRERPRSFVPSGSLSRAVLVLLSCWVPFSIITIAAQLPVLEFLDRVESGGEFTMEEAHAADARVATLGIAGLAGLVATGVVFLVWYRRVYRNVLWFGADRMSESLTWASWSWVVPIACWFVPYRVVRETWRGSDPDTDLTETRGWRTGSASALLISWWLAWVVANLLSGLVSRIAERTGTGIDGLRAKIRVDIAGDAFLALAAVLAILVVLEIDRRQARKAPVVLRAIAAWKGAAEQAEDGAPAPGR